MAHVLLRSGSLNDFQAVGNNGQAVFESAVQIREALRLRGLELAASILAIPQVDESGQRVGWYAPAGKRVESWIGADGETRRKALRQLERCLEEITTLSERSQRASGPAVRRFGLLLARAFTFPGVNHVFLVDGRPVITFWGFIAHHQKVPEDALTVLRGVVAPEPLPEPEAVPPVETALPVPESEPDPEPLNSQAVASGASLYEATSAIPAEQEETEFRASAKRSRRLPLMGGVALMLCIASAAAWFMLSREPGVEAPMLPVREEAKPQSGPVKAPEPPAPSTLPLQPATVTPPPLTPGALVLPADAVKAGSTRFLNGHWRISGENRGPVIQSEKRPVLHAITLQIKDNEGTATLVLDGSLSCKTEIHSGLMPSGALMVKGRARARCSDGSRYPMPEISCRQGETGAALCEARYNDKEQSLPLTFKKVSK
ncbi:hypothetical protein GIX45_02025 [Erwinia sp. CPCC 100877]|nr:hypothetical protein [Erwinia sp. CPCC 100877]